MSCIMVNDFHLDALVTWGAAHQASWYRASEGRHVDMRGNEPAAAELLHAANAAAFRERYPRDAEPIPPHRYRARAVAWLPAVQAVKACDCLAYQCSDWTGWPESEAFRVLDAIRDAAIQRLPGYSAAAWELRP